jgi:hypothetical protein
MFRCQPSKDRALARWRDLHKLKNWGRLNALLLVLAGSKKIELAVEEQVMIMYVLVGPSQESNEEKRSRSIKQESERR